MLFAGWIYLAFFLFPTEIHGRFLYYGVVLLALPALRNKMLLGAYVDALGDPLLQREDSAWNASRPACTRSL